ncbi:tape measure protein [Phascolarctobacterium faecium]|mgnify:FL=1|uniref:tape measure protein n=1 Tax=Phascolarctobacterium faecium TaxID=33025 RepID=UPI003AEF4307
MAEKIEVQINGESQGFDAAAARAAQQAARLETALNNVASSQSKAASAAAQAAGSTDQLANAQKGAADAAAKAARQNDKTKDSLDGIRTASTLAAAAIATATAAMGLGAVKAAGKMEQLEIAFTTMLGNAEQAKTMLNDLQDFAQVTPFDLESVTNGSRRLLAMGFSAEQIIPVMTAVGDAAAGLGMQAEGIDRITLAMGQMAAKGKVSAEEIRQLAEAGIPAWKFISESLGITIPEAMKRAEQSQISAAQGLNAIVAGMNSKFGGMMEAQSHTIDGMWSNLMDGISRTSISVGKDIVESFDLHKKLAKAMDFFDEFRERVDNSGLRSAIIQSVPTEVVAAAFVAIDIAVVTTLIPAISKAIKAFRALRAAMLSTPIGLAATGVAAVATLAYDKAQEYELGGQERADLLQGVFDAEGIEGYEEYVTKAAGVVEDWDKISSDNDPYAAIRDAAEHARKLEAPPDFSNLGDYAADAGGGSSGRKGSGRTKRDTSAQEAKAYIDLFDKMVQKAEAFKSLWDGITGTRNTMFDNAAEQVKKATESYNAARDARIKAEAEGNAKAAELIAETEAQRLQYLQQTEAKANEVFADSLLQRKNAMQEYNNEMQTLAENNQAAILAAFQGRLSAEQEMELEQALARQQQMIEEQELRQAYYDWQLESQESLLSFGLEAAQTLKDGLASGLASIITEGAKLEDVLKNLGKQILNMFIQWIVGRQLAAVFSKMANKMALAETKGIAAASAAAWEPAAALAEAAVPGSIARGEGLAAAVAGRAAGIGADFVSGSSDSGGLGSDSFMAGGLDSAMGGLNTGGVGLGDSSFMRGGISSIPGGIGGSVINVTSNNYGQINNGWDADQLLGGLNDSVLGALRSS